MGRPNVTTRTRSLLERLATGLEDQQQRVLILSGGMAVSIGAHALFAEEQLAWLAAPVVLLAGFTGHLRTAVTLAIVAAVGHGVIDLATDNGAAEIVGSIIRGVVLVFLALAGTASAQLGQQRDRALHRAYSEDPVTGLLNVRILYDEVERLQAANDPFSVVLADIRGMRDVNEAYGHPTGTEAMRALAHVLRRAAGADVIAYRQGSDEVAVLLTGDDQSSAREIVADVIQRLQDEPVGLPDGGTFEVHAAYGIASWPQDGADPVSLLRAADRAKERAKQAGLDSVGVSQGDEVAIYDA
jgi:diguanylate cyclase (GGDEF)-like protein